MFSKQGLFSKSYKKISDRYRKKWILMIKYIIIIKLIKLYEKFTC